MANPRPTRRTRFVVVSDTHNGAHPDSFQIPKGDVFIHAGDLTNQGTFSELKMALNWIEGLDFEAKIVVAGMLLHSHSLYDHSFDYLRKS